MSDRDSFYGYILNFVSEGISSRRHPAAVRRSARAPAILGPAFNLPLLTRKTACRRETSVEQETMKSTNSQLRYAIRKMPMSEASLTRKSSTPAKNTATEIDMAAEVVKSPENVMAGYERQDSSVYWSTTLEQWTPTEFPRGR